MIRWEVIKRSVSLRGMDIGNLRIRNKALLAKWLGHFSSKPNSLWYRIIASKHGPHPFKWLAKGFKGTDRNLWKDISKELPSFVLLVRCVVGEGRGTYLWEDNWVWERPICGLFPGLYHLSPLKNHFVVGFLVWSGSSCSFSFGFHHSLSNRESTNVVSLLSLLESHPFTVRRRDVRVWSPNPL